MSETTDNLRIRSGAWFVRTGGFFAFWVIIAGTKPADLAAGVVAAFAAAAVSLQLLPPGQGRLRPVLLLGLALRFLRQSVRAGVDVAWRALHPRMPLSPGFVVYQPRSRGVTQREVFCTMTSLLPGTLPTDVEQGGGILIHCLDTTQPVTEQLAHEERLLLKAIGEEVRNE
jgi:multicomponent Na+:H+ antiporter subunit E